MQINSISPFHNKFKSLTQRNVLALLFLIISTSSLLIVINYFTIKTISATRAYTNGESQYSKGQKDAAHHLAMYVYTEDSAYWKLFLHELEVPIGDSIARVALTKQESEEIARKGFLAGRNHPDDHHLLIWLFQNFKNISFMKNAISIWKEADKLVGKQHELGQEIHSQVTNRNLGESGKLVLMKRINEITMQLTVKEREFSNELGAAARTIDTYLFYTNLLLTLIIIASAAGYAAAMIGKVQQSQQELANKNQDLTQTNQQLDSFVYSASHDLRAPITSLKGLIQIARFESDPIEWKKYLDLMQHSLDRQDQFISDIIQFSKNKRIEVTLQPVSIVSTTEDTLKQHQFMTGHESLKISTYLDVDTVMFDPLRLSIILNNLISNAIKYSDPAKETQMITIRSFSESDKVCISVQDNGLGIEAQNLEKIFDMFYVTQNNNKGSGLGLYIAKQAAEKLNSSLQVTSAPGVGTTFQLIISNHNITDHSVTPRAATLAGSSMPA